MKPCHWCIRCKTGQMFIDIRIDCPFLVNSAETFATILFDTVVVAVTIASTLGPWRLHQRSTWETMSLPHLLAQQCGWYLPFHVNSDDQNSRSDEIRVFLHWSLANKMTDRRQICPDNHCCYRNCWPGTVTFNFIACWYWPDASDCESELCPEP